MWVVRGCFAKMSEKQWIRPLIFFLPNSEKHLRNLLLLCGCDKEVTENKFKSGLAASLLST